MKLSWIAAAFGVVALLGGCVGPEVQGKVVNAEGQPIQGAMVQSDGDTAQTDDSGFYALEDVGFGEYHTISVTAPGYENQRLTVYAPKGYRSGMLQQDFVLQQKQELGATTQPAGMPRQQQQQQQPQQQQQGDVEVEGQQLQSSPPPQGQSSPPPR